MAIKINLMPPKDSVIAGEKSPRPFYFLIIFVFFVASSLIYLGIYSYNTFFLKKQIDAAEEKKANIQLEISKIATPGDFAAAGAAMIKGKNIHSILSAHLYTSRIYELLESLTIKTVSYSKFSEKINDNKTISVSVSGETGSFGDLAKQLVVFKKSAEIDDVIFKEAAAGKDGKVSFSVILSVDLKLLMVRPVITLVGPSAVEVAVGSAYADAGATAVDGIDGRIKVTTSGSVNTSVVGTYILTYKAVNAAGNFQTANRIVKVVSP